MVRKFQNFVIMLFVILFLIDCSTLKIYPDLHNLKSVQLYANSFPYISDKVNYDEDEYFAAPKEFEEHGGGDCEDYAIYKAYLLIKNGLAKPSDLKMIGVLVKSDLLMHAVLVYKDKQVLDSRFDDIFDIDSEKFKKEYLLVESNIDWLKLCKFCGQEQVFVGLNVKTPK